MYILTYSAGRHYVWTYNGTYNGRQSLTLIWTGTNSYHDILTVFHGQDVEYTYYPGR